jgi:hypothetical protein
MAGFAACRSSLMSNVRHQVHRKCLTNEAEDASQDDSAE